jgi:hypothetical protein
MNIPRTANSPVDPQVPNGSGAAAVLSAGIGSFALAILAIAGEKWPLVKTSLNFYSPAGPLSGVTTVAILIWILAWGVLEGRWRSRAIAMGRIAVAAFVLLALSLLLTFPPIADLF